MKIGNLCHLFLQSKPFQNVEFEDFIQPSSQIVLILFGMNYLMKLIIDNW